MDTQTEIKITATLWHQYNNNFFFKQAGDHEYSLQRLMIMRNGMLFRKLCFRVVSERYINYFIQVCEP